MDKAAAKDEAKMSDTLITVNCERCGCIVRLDVLRKLPYKKRVCGCGSEWGIHRGIISTTRILLKSYHTAVKKEVKVGEQCAL